MSGVRFLDLAKPFVPYIPEIRVGEVKKSFQARAVWTGIALLIFLVMSQVPLYGIVSSDSSDPMYWLRMMMASNRGTLMELGITPIITAGTVFQLLTAVQKLDVNMTVAADVELYQTAQKLLAIVFSISQALVYVFSGLYGPPSELGLGVCILLVVQLVVAGLIVILLDELLQKGYGLSSGISLFIATNVCESIFWKAFSPTTINTGRGPQFEGAVICLVHLLATWPDKQLALREAFFRTSQPNIMNLLATALIFAIVVYLQTFHVIINLRDQQGSLQKHPVPLFYTSNMPIMLQSALSSNIFILSQLLYSRFGDFFLVRWLGTWEPWADGSSQLKAVSGIAYFMSPPVSISEALLDPIHTVVYIIYMMGACAMFSKMWIEVSHSSPRDLYRQFKKANLAAWSGGVPGLRDALFKNINAAASFGGAIIGLLSVASDMLGALGSGTSILLAVTIIYGYVKMAAEEEALNAKNK